MDSNILCQLLAKRIPPEQFQLHGCEVVFYDPEQNNKPCTAPDESPYDTPENRAIVDDVIVNYDALAEAYRVEKAAAGVADKAKTALMQIDIASIRSIREYIAAKEDAPEYLKTYEAQAMEERSKAE